MAQQQQAISKIVVPIDGSRDSMEAADYAIKMAEKYESEVSVVHVVNIDQYLQALGLYRVSYPDSIKKKVEEAKAEAQKWFAEITRNAEQRKVRIKTDVVDSPMSVVSSIVQIIIRKLDLMLAEWKNPVYYQDVQQSEKHILLVLFSYHMHDLFFYIHFSFLK